MHVFLGPDAKVGKKKSNVKSRDEKRLLPQGGIAGNVIFPPPLATQEKSEEMNAKAYLVQ